MLTKKWFRFVGVLSIPLIANFTRASEGLDIPEALEHKVVLDSLEGVNLIFARMYNEQLVLYAITCTLLMAIIGIAIAFVAEVILKAIGIDSGKIEHKE